jgi:hypothetical protein
MPVAGQNAVVDRAAVQREAEMRATIVEREDATPVMDDQQWTRTAVDDGHPLGLQLRKSPDADPITGQGLRSSVVARLGHRSRPAITAGGNGRGVGMFRDTPYSAADSHSSTCRQALIAGCEPAGCGMNQRESRVSSRPARRWRCSAIPRWFGLTVIPSSRER